MADEVNIRLSVTGDAKVRAAFREIQSDLKVSGRVVSEFGNIFRVFGNSTVNGVANSIESAVIGIRAMNSELGKSKAALAGIGAIGFATGAGVGYAAADLF